VEIGLRDPRSQKRDLGHPSISPFDIAEGTSFVISLPTRLSESAARDEKGESGFSTWDWLRIVSDAKEKPQVSPLRYAPVEMTNLWGDEIPRFQERSAELQIPRLRSG
jgi:hypothetical protein